MTDRKRTILFPLLWIIGFGTAMGSFEASVVVYLRELYYPDGFGFPMRAMDTAIARVEIFREAASLVMLVMVALLAAKRASKRLGTFLLAFAIWDITYYLFLKIFLGWPPSFFTWDILFLIPVTWTGPVIAPVFNSLTMILLGTALFHFGSLKERALPGKPEWILLLTGTFLTLFVYMQDFTAYMLDRFTLGEWWTLPTPAGVLDYAMAYVPRSFNWPVFLAGEFSFLAAIIWYFRRMMRELRQGIL